MNKYILQAQVQEFIHSFSGELSKLAFSGSPFENITIQQLLQQIESRRKIEQKLPTWYKTKGIYYPPKLNLEQTSSEVTAGYKASLVTGRKMADITGGFGVDSYYFSKDFAHIDHFEINNELSEIAGHNATVLNIHNISFKNMDGVSRLKEKHYDLIFADPSRRDNHKRKQFLLEDCVPDITLNLERLFNVAPVVLLKTSPMLDLSAGLGVLVDVAEIHVVAVQNEVKELLWLLKKGYQDGVKIKTVNFISALPQKFEFMWSEKAEPQYAVPKSYLYEPNGAIMKSGGFDIITKSFNVHKLHPNTQLYTSDILIDFPGRRFKIQKIVPYSKKAIGHGIDFDKANISTRNFPETVAEIRNRWKIKDGGNCYMFFTTGPSNEKIILICEKITA